ncbi:hypothetical protein FQR65_LT10242 [Abscondita terminalis]|nr:hypothetical protein FQR65_LT10242 [Abscondita terminalis]
MEEFRYMQYVAALTSSLISACSNMITTWSSPAIVQLTSKESPIGITLNNVLPLYVGEITDKDIRGRLTTAISIMSSLGSAYVLSVGPFVSYIALALSCAAVPLLFANRKIDESKRTLRRLLRSTVSEDVINERMIEIQQTVTSQRETKSYWRDIVFTTNFQIAIIIVLGAKFVFQFSGATVLKSYLQTIIASSDSSISPEVSSVIFGMVQLPSSIVIQETIPHD